jgi:hypothetical protein
MSGCGLSPGLDPLRFVMFFVSFMIPFPVSPGIPTALSSPELFQVGLGRLVMASTSSRRAGSYPHVRPFPAAQTEETCQT